MADIIAIAIAGVLTVNGVVLALAVAYSLRNSNTSVSRCSR